MLSFEIIIGEVGFVVDLFFVDIVVEVGKDMYDFEVMGVDVDVGI